jgi:spore coat protein U-like protein
MNIKTAFTFALLAFGSMAAAQADAATATTSFNVKITITSTCTVDTPAATDVNFGTVASTATNVANAGALNVNCTNRTPYTIALDNGQNFGTGPLRNMKGGTGADLVAYQLYQDTNHTLPWGSTSGAGGNVFAGTGSGSVQNVPVYGVVPSANSPAGSYNDVVTATLTY